MKQASPRLRNSFPLLLITLFLWVGCGKDDTAQVEPLYLSLQADSSEVTAMPEPTAEPTAEPAAEPAADSGTDSGTDSAEPDRSGQVLRHAVFFRFKDESSEADVQGVADAFADLPSKIDAIRSFQWGVNDSQEGFSDGFTHCFLLSFDDTAGRDAYIPDPAHAGGFADALRPHMKAVFVFDYWGTPPKTKLEKELKHAVFFKFKDDASREDVQRIEEEFAALPSKIDSIKAFEWGTNNSPEKKNDGFTHCFMVTFDSDEGRQAYLPHADHQAFVKLLTPALDKVRVLDFWEQ